MKYAIAMADHSRNKSLDEVVEEMIADGWRPQGGLSPIRTGAYGWQVCQAMVKQEGLSERDALQGVYDALGAGTDHNEWSQVQDRIPAVAEMMTVLRELAQKGLGK